jgi:hypothetical protein
MSRYPPQAAAILFDHSTSQNVAERSCSRWLGTVCRNAGEWVRPGMADTDPVTSPDTDHAYAQGDQDAEPTMTAPSGPRPDAATHPDPSDEYADKPDAEGDS